MTPVPCTAGGDTSTTLRWRQFTDGSIHIEERCARCDEWRRFAPKTDENIRNAKPEKDDGESQMPLFGAAK